jgi:DNA invertase Pin-like site-specific DNA recombinase
MDAHLPTGHNHGMADALHLIGYARVSTEDQDLRLQTDALTAAGVALEAIYSEKASGAAGKKRPALVAALKDCREGDVLVVWKLDRLGRSLEELIVTMRRLDEKKANLRVLTGLQIDTATAGGRFIFHIFSALAEFERELIRERTIAGLKAAKARGRVGGRRVQFGPASIEKARKLLVAGETVPAVAKAIGCSKSTIHKWFPGGAPAPVHDPETNEVTGK